MESLAGRSPGRGRSDAERDRQGTEVVAAEDQPPAGVARRGVNEADGANFGADFQKFAST